MKHMPSLSASSLLSHSRKCGTTISIGFKKLNAARFLGVQSQRSDETGERPGGKSKLPNKDTPMLISKGTPLGMAPQGMLKVIPCRGL